MASSSSDPTPAQIQSQFEQAIVLSLHLWPALTLAVQNNWGGPDSDDKRSWFAGAVAELFPDLSTSPVALAALRTSKSSPSLPTNSPDSVPEEPDVETIEDMLLQVMIDEFEVNVDDESAYIVAEQIFRLRRLCARGKFDEVNELTLQHQAKRGKTVVFTKGQDQEDEDESGWEDDSSNDGGDDVDMDEAPSLVMAPKVKSSPEVDEDGFTKVTRKKR